MFSTMVSSIAADHKFWIRMVTSRNSKIQVMLDQGDDPELDDYWLTANDGLTSFRKYREKIVVRVKGSDSP